MAELDLCFWWPRHWLVAQAPCSDVTFDRGVLAFEQGGSDPEKVFDRTANLENTQIISYRVDEVEKWCVLTGIAQGAPERCGPKIRFSFPK